MWRSYSIATPATEQGVSQTCEFAVTAIPKGLATTYLFGLKVGDRIRTSGPFGRFTLAKDDPMRYLLIGTGTGMAPFRAMLPEIERRAAMTGRAAPRVTLIMGVRGPDDCLYAQDFHDFVDAAPHARQLLVSYSRNMPDNPARFERSGYVQEQLRTFDLWPGNDRILLCGNPDMIETCSNLLEARGFDRKSLMHEKYVAGPAPR